MSEYRLDSAQKPAPKHQGGAEGRRSILQVRVDILRVISQGFGKPTQVMYKANLSWNVLQSQLKAFVDAGLVSEEEYGNRRRYTITQKGLEVIQSYSKVEDEFLVQ